jgi:hypothetical protein
LTTFDSALVQGLGVRLNLLNHAIRAGDAQSIALQREELECFLQAANAISALFPQIRTALEGLQPAETEPVQPALEPILPAGPEQPGSPDIYWISSAIMAEAHAYLTRHVPETGDEPEWMLAVTGLHQGNLRTLEHLIEVKVGSQSRAQAAFDIQDFTRVAVSLYEHGQALHAIFHSHRFSGAPHPSGIDDHLQRILEEGGYPAIQAVFSEDGYVRFFARQRRFAIQVHGKGVEHVDGEEFLFRIVHFGALPHPALALPRAGRGNGL